MKFAKFVIAAIMITMMSSAFCTTKNKVTPNLGMQSLLVEIQNYATLSDSDKVARLNKYINDKIVYVNDNINWKKNDYWATPEETMAKGAGDCEDYAILKYFALRKAGISNEQLRMVYVRADIGGLSVGHMVLAYYPQNDEPVVLDNTVNEVRSVSRRSDLKPVFTFNTEGIWEGISGEDVGNPADRLSKWADLLTRVKKEKSLQVL